MIVVDVVVVGGGVVAAAAAAAAAAAGVAAGAVDAVAVTADQPVKPPGAVATQRLQMSTLVDFGDCVCIRMNPVVQALLGKITETCKTSLCMIILKIGISEIIVHIACFPIYSDIFKTIVNR